MQIAQAYSLSGYCYSLSAIQCKDCKQTDAIKMAFLARIHNTAYIRIN